MGERLDIHLEHLTRVEGHGNVTLNAVDGKVEKVEWTVVEAPRYFEAFVRGRPYHQVASVTSRICGICSIGHTLASLKATEAAMGIGVSSQTVEFRRLALHGENLQSHVLHVGYLVAPDLFGAGSVFPMLKTHPETVTNIVKLHRLANEMSDLVCGRTTHPTNLIPGGMWKVPSPVRLKEVRDRLEAGIDTFNAVAEVVLGNAEAIPGFRRETEFIALTSEKEYALYDGVIGSTETDPHPVGDYRSVVNEYLVPQSTAKYCRHARESYMVGALARFNLNADRLSPLAKRWAEDFGLKPVCHNPFMNSVAQLVECIHSVEDSMALIDRLLANGYDTRNICAKTRIRAGRGIGAVDVPRGILFHDYAYDDDGTCVKANCVIPTNQNHNNIQKDMEALAPTLLGKPEKEIELNLEMLVRAYDPCISCSTHYLDVRFVRE
jgi:sulfhydrogenase subunit alpha